MSFLGVFSKGMTAFCTSHKLCHCFVSTTCLYHPNKNFAVPTFLALLFYLRHSIDFVFVSYDCNERFGFRLNNGACSSLSFSVYRLLSKVTFSTAENKGVAYTGFFGFKTWTAIGTKFHTLQNPSLLFFHKPRPWDISIIFSQYIKFAKNQRNLK